MVPNTCKAIVKIKDYWEELLMQKLHLFKLEIIDLLTSILRKLETTLADPSDLYYCYRLLLGRRPKNEDWKMWLLLIHRGMMRGDLADMFISSEEFRNKYGIKPPACVNTDDFMIYVDADDFLVGRPIAQHKYWEPHITTIIRRELRPDNTFVDIGANMGWFTLVAASILRYGGKVFAIEPNYNNLQLLYRSIIANRLQNVIVYPYAVTETNHILQLNFARSNGFVSQVGDVGNSTTYVQGVSLDNLLKDEPKIDFIKIDIEGHEPIALKGMQGIIKKHRPLIITEFYPKLIKAYSGLEPADYLKALIALDYKLSVIQENGSEVSLSNETETLAYWKDYNQKLGTGDLTHIDLVARPI